MENSHFYSIHQKQAFFSSPPRRRSPFLTSKKQLACIVWCHDGDCTATILTSQRDGVSWACGQGHEAG